MLQPRAQHVAQTIRPALMAGDLVICDRFTASTVAYQVFARGIDRGITETLNQFVVGECVPDHTFYLNVSLAESCRRRVERNQPVDRMEEEGSVFHGKVISGFEKIATNDSRPKSILDASEDKEQQPRACSLMFGSVGHICSQRKDGERPPDRPRVASPRRRHRNDIVVGENTLDSL